VTTQGQATAIRNGAESAAREMYSQFRYNAKKLFPDLVDRTALNLNGRVLDDTQQFIGQARLSYKAAQSDARAAHHSPRVIHRPPITPNSLIEFASNVLTLQPTRLPTSNL